jgi:hypothetical protein
MSSLLFIRNSMENEVVKKTFIRNSWITPYPWQSLYQSNCEKKDLEGRKGGSHNRCILEGSQRHNEAWSFLLFLSRSVLRL